MRRFDARYDGRCAHCGGDIIEGDSIGFIDDQIACEDCCDDEEDR